MKTILESVAGSTLHGTAVSDGLEDLDLMAVVLEDARQLAGFSPQDVWVTRTKPNGVRSEAGDVDRAAYGLRKYLSLALKGNPTVLLPLFAPLHLLRELTEEGRQLRALAPALVSKQALEPFRGYMRQQHERLLGTRGQKNVTRPELVERFGYDTKYAGHILRLGFQGEELLLTGRITLPMPESQRALVVAVRSGEYTLPQVSALIDEAETRLAAAGARSPLQLYPRVQFVEAWMLETYLSHWGQASRAPRF